MSIKKYRFVSPGIFLKEVDRSQIPREAELDGPLVIGSTLRGPGLRPVKVRSLDELERVFGLPVPGGKGEDVWREGGSGLAPTYATYAAQAYLSAPIPAPVNIVRLLGVQDAAATANGKAGWTATETHGIFLFRSGSSEATLGAVLYTDTTDMNFRLRGVSPVNSASAISGSNLAVAPNASGDFVLLISNIASGGDVSTSEEVIPFNFNRNSERFIRKTLNTNPVVTNPEISEARSGSHEDKYWLGESFEEIARISRTGNTDSTSDTLQNLISVSGSGDLRAFTAKLVDPATNSGTLGSYLLEAKAARSGWVFSQDLGEAAGYDATSKQKLFKIHSINQGYCATRDFKVSIRDIKIADDTATNPYGSFTVVLRDSRDTDANPVVREQFTNCNLNPRSPDYVARKIGDVYFEWDAIEKRYKHYGNYLNNSDFIRVEVHPDVDNGLVDASLVPFGFYGPVVPNDLTLATATGSSPLAGSEIRDDGPDFPTAGGAGSDYRLIADKASGGTTNWVTGSLVHSGTTAATATLTTAGNGNANHGNTAGQKITLTSTDGTIVDYFFSNINRGGRGHLGTVTAGQQLDSTGPITATLTAGATGIAVGYNTAGADSKNQNEVLALLKAAIEHSDGHAGKILVSAVPGAAAEAQSITLTQATAGAAGNTAITEDLDGITATAFTQGAGTLLESAYIVKQHNTHPEGAGAGHSLTKIKWPSPMVVISGSIGSSGDLGKTYLGWTTEQLDSTGKPTGQSQHYYGWTDQIRPIGNTLYDSGDVSSLPLSQKNSFVFSLDDVMVSQDSDGVYGDAPDPDASGRVRRVLWNVGSRAAGTSYTATVETGSAKLLRLGVDSFTMPLVGGFDGVNIREADPFNNRVLKSSTDAAQNYAQASVQRAIDASSDPEVVECNVMAAPGITEPTLTKKLVEAAENRADALAVIDLPDVYVTPFEELCTTFKDRLKTTAKLSAKNLKDRSINSSYGATYYPWVKIYDDENDAQVWVPPSVIALGVFGFTEARDEIWFAPAGFNRGGLNSGNAGFPVLNTSEQLSSKERDILYEAGINPIAKFPSEGIVVFGQKTLQVTRSALDRINVRRLLIFIKKRISQIAAGLIFDQNVPATWARFRGQVNPFLSSVKTRLGLTDYKVVLDETTTTPDLVDRNVLYAKIFLKPARSVEFIAVDFVITRTGASFDDL